MESTKQGYNLRHMRDQCGTRRQIKILGKEAPKQKIAFDNTTF